MAMANVQDISAAQGRLSADSPRVEAAPGVMRSEAPAFAHGERSLYAGRVKVYPKAVMGRFRLAKWTVLALCLSAYYLAPWLRWDRGPNLPDQALLIDMPSRHTHSVRRSRLRRTAPRTSRGRRGRS